MCKNPFSDMNHVNHENKNPFSDMCVNWPSSRMPLPSCPTSLKFGPLSQPQSRRVGRGLGTETVFIEIWRYS